MLRSAFQFRRLVCFLSVILLVAATPSWAHAADVDFATAGSIVSASLDDWLALGMALLAALFCIQKREQ